MEFNETLHFAMLSGLYLACAFIVFLVGRACFQLFNPSIQVKHELVEKDNFAFSLTYVGYFIGLVFAIGAAIVGPSNGWLQDIIDIGLYSLLGIILLNLSRWINDKFILRNFSIRKEIIEDQNAGTGIIEAANSIASGLIIYGAVTGDNTSGMHGVLSAVLFWAIGQFLMVLTTWIFNKCTPYNIHDEIEKDNVAVGVGLAGALIAIANLVRNGISGDFEDWTTMFENLGFDFLLGIIMLPIARVIADKILLPGRKLTDELVNQEKPNVGAGVIEAFAYIGSSVVICWCL